MDTQEPKQGNPIEDIQSTSLQLSRVEVIVHNARQTFDQLFIECGGDAVVKDLDKRLNKLIKSGATDIEAEKEYKEISKGYSKYRIPIEKQKAVVKRDIIDAGKGVEGVVNLFMEKLSGEEKADAKLAEIKLLRKQQEEKEANDKLEKTNLRIKTLNESGLVYDGVGAYVINEINVYRQTIEELTDEAYEDLLGKVKVQKALNDVKAKQEAERIENERKEQERIRLENEATAQKLKEQQEALATQQKAFELQQQELQRKQKEAQDLIDKQAKEAKEKEERQTLAVKAQPYESLGYKTNFLDTSWSIQIGENKSIISKETMLQSDDVFFQKCKEEIEKWNNEKEEAEKEKAIGERFAKRRIELLELGFTITPTGSFKIEFSKELSKTVLENVIRDETDEEYNAFILSIKSDIEKEAERKRISLQDDTEKFTEYLQKLSAIPAPELKDESLAAKVVAIQKLIKQ